jgi:putative colanic acid biosynthesis glycosyltransferase
VPILSVITVVKDDPNGLRRTLESVSEQVLSQQYSQSWELLVVDGSKPSLAESAMNAGIKQLRLVRQEPAGIYAAMNFGVSEASGDYLLFLNAGDTLANPTVLESLMEQLERESPSWAFGRVNFTSESGRMLAEPTWNYDSEAKRLFARGLFPSHQGTVMRRELVSQLGGFDQSFKIASDYHLMIRAHLEAKPLELNLVIADFQQGGASTLHWRAAIGEFHRARIEVFKPGGFTKVREFADTWVQYVKTGIGHAVKGFRRG